MNIRAVYFSGTGTTAKLTSAIADRLAEELAAQPEAGEDYSRAEDIDFTPPQARRTKYKFLENDLVVFGMPVIAGRVPNVLLKFLNTLQGGGALTVPIVLYGNRDFDDALIELRDILQERGFHVIGAAAFIGEHSFSRILAAGRPDSSDMELSSDFARRLAGKIHRHGAEKLRMAAPVPVGGDRPLRPYYKPQDRDGNSIDILKVKPRLNAELCSGCGTCIDACPMGSITRQNLPQHIAPITGICIKCCACVKKCPAGAWYFDDPGFLYHKQELEKMHAGFRREPAIYL